MWTQKLYTFFCGAFRPPFRGLPWILLIYLIIAVIYNKNSSLNTWHLPDTDDYIRLVQVGNWLDGHSWFDFSLPHLYPQHIITMHWARLPDIALAFMITAAQAVTSFFQIPIPRTALSMFAAFVVPCFLMLALLNLVKTNARPLLGRNYAGIACFFVVLAGILTFQFTPMRVDHHAYILLAAGAAFFALQNIYLGIRPLRMAALATLAFSLGMWNGAEILPMLILFGITLTVILIKPGRKRDACGVVFGYSLLLGTALVLTLAKAPADYLKIEYDTFSVFYVMIAAVAAAYFTVLFLLSLLTRRRVVKAAFSLFFALGSVSIFLHFFPDFILGPYAKTNPLLNHLFFPNIREAVPLTKSWEDLGDNFGTSPSQSIGGSIYYMATRIFLPLMALGGCAYGIFNNQISRRQRGLWLIYLLFCLVFDLLTTLWEVRLLTYAQMFAIPPTAALMMRYLRVLPKHYSGRQLYMWEILTIFSFTLFPAIIVPAILGQDKFMPDMLFFLGKGNPAPCSTLNVVDQLNLFEHDQKKISTIMAPMDYTPELMFYTHHNYIAAPYHRNNRGIIDMLLFFRSVQDDLAARRIAQRLDLDYVVLCKKAYTQNTLQVPTSGNLVVDVAANKIEEKINDKALLGSSLAQRLAKDKTPTWLKPISIPFETDFMLFEVKKNLLGKPTQYSPMPKKQCEG